MHRRTFCLMLLSPLAAGCAATGPVPIADRDVAALNRAIRALGPGVDPAEAGRAASVAYSETAALARAYAITDPPLVHNAKVNAGLRPRGLCWHWAEDMQARLDAEGFETLRTHRAIANADNAFRLDHSTAIVSRRGDAFQDGIVLDPWRNGGRLHWVPTRQDDRYEWVARAEVLARKYGEA